MKNVAIGWTLPTTRQNGQALPSSAILKVNVERSSDNGITWTSVAMLTGPAVTTVDHDVQNGTYQYRVNAVDTANLPGTFAIISNIVVEDPPLPANPEAPTNLVGVQNGASINLSWVLPTLRQNGNALPIGELASYALEASTNGGSTWSVVNAAIVTNTSFTWVNAPYATYKFRVRVTDTVGLVGANSAEITVAHLLPANPVAPTDLVATPYIA